MDIDIVPILEHYGLEVPNPEPGETWTRVLCEFHGEQNASASYTQYAYNCFGCGLKGDAIAVVMWKEELGYLGALKFIEGILGEGVRAVPPKPDARRRRLFDGTRKGPESGVDRQVPSRRRRRPFSGS